MADDKRKAWTRAKHIGILGLCLPLHGPTIVGSPVGIRQLSTDLQVAIRAENNGLYLNTRILLTWWGFSNLKFATNANPGIASWADMGLFVFAKSTDGTISMRQFRHGFDYNYGRWSQLGDKKFNSPPVGVSVRGKSDTAYLVALD